MKKTYSIIIIVLLVILTAINVWVIADRSNGCEGQCSNDHNSVCYVAKTISLNEAQKEQYTQIKKKYQQQAILIADSLHINQENLMRELMRNNNDSILLKQMEEKVAECQGKLLHLSVEQYFEIRNILTSEQIPALDRLFAQILICRPTCNHRDDDGGTIPHLD